MKFLIVLLVVVKLFAAADNLVTIRGTLVRYDKNVVVIKTETNRELTFQRSYAGNLDGFIAGKALIQFKVPAKDLLAQDTK